MGFSFFVSFDFILPFCYNYVEDLCDWLYKCHTRYMVHYLTGTNVNTGYVPIPVPLHPNYLLKSMTVLTNTNEHIHEINKTIHLTKIKLHNQLNNQLVGL